MVLETTKHLLDKLTVVSLEGRGHWLMLEVPDTVTQEILAWLESLGIARPSSANKSRL